ncbi:CheW-like protein domain protein [mine drainage metagenome]|uniref:CheW-like protein domain protein n=1 Tax=mine drainage metagenome TaxID=410659 RepID=T1A9D3_9ZZZZ
MVLTVGHRRLALAVEQLLGEQEIVLKPLSQFLGTLPSMIGAALMPSGNIALVVDVRELVLSETES